MARLLGSDDLLQLVRSVFSPGPGDTRLMILVDLPDSRVADNPAWAARRQMAFRWYSELAPRAGHLGLLGVDLVLYGNVGTNNGDLPAEAMVYEGGALPQRAEELVGLVSFEHLFASHSLVFAPTEFSTTAPLKVAARGRNLRAATMPGFSSEMIPALRIDYGEVARRVNHLKRLLDDAASAEIRFGVDDEVYDLVLDLRHRTAHASTGRFPLPGEAGNLPSGEAYIVPYEGERDGDPSRSSGQLPVQLGGEVVVYDVIANKAQPPVAERPQALAEAERVRSEPAYANLAELGFGVLEAFGLRPIGELLLDEKLGLHIAFGRSDHFGGMVGPADFSAPDKVAHIDRVYVPAAQPRVLVKEVALVNDDGPRVTVMKDGVYVVDFG